MPLYFSLINEYFNSMLFLLFAVVFIGAYIGYTIPTPGNFVVDTGAGPVFMRIFIVAATTGGIVAFYFAMLLPEPPANIPQQENAIEISEQENNHTSQPTQNNEQKPAFLR